MKKLFFSLFLISTLFLTNSVFSQSSTNILILNGFKITTIIESVGTNSSLNTNNLNNSSVNNNSNSTNTSSVTSNLLQVAGISTNGQKIAQDLINNFIDAAPYISNNIVNLDFAGFYNPSQKDYGYFFGADLPVGNQTSLGVGSLHLASQWDLVPVSLKLGTTIDYPVFGQIYNFIGTGPLIDLNNGKLGSYNVLGGVKTFEFLKDWKLSLGAGVSDVSTIKGINLNVYLRLNYHF